MSARRDFALHFRDPLACFPLRALLLGVLIATGQSATSAPSDPRVAEVLQPYVDDGTLAGAVALVATPSQVVSVHAVGWKDIAAKQPMRVDCLFWIASQSKPITGAALMVLVDQGKVKVDDPVEKYLPEFKDVWVKAESGEAQITLRRPDRPLLIRDLLTHTSGLPFKSLIEQPTLDLYPLETRVHSYPMLLLATQPGSKYAYSNAGINTVGRIVEVVSGQSFETFIDQWLFQPMGMKDTTFWPSASQLERLAKAYEPEGPAGRLKEIPINQLHYPLSDRMRQPMPAGGLFSTAADLLRFYQMLANGGIIEGRRVLSEASVRQMTSDQTGALNANYGFGISANPNGFAHGGAYNTHSRYDRSTGLITIFLVQHAKWNKEGAKILPAFQKVATAAYVKTAASADAPPVVGIPGVNHTPNPTERAR